MPLYLRIIKAARWLPPDDASWLRAGEIQADPLADLPTSQNCLSVYRVRDDRSNLQQVIAALASERDEFKHFEYALFDHEIIVNLHIETRKTLGRTKDETVNGWHYDLVDLSAPKLVALATELLSHSSRDRCFKGDVEQLIVEAVRTGRLATDQLNRKIKERVKSLLQ